MNKAAFKSDGETPGKSHLKSQSDTVPFHLNTKLNKKQTQVCLCWKIKWEHVRAVMSGNLCVTERKQVF